MAVEGGILRLAIFMGLIIVLWNMTDNIGKVMLIIYAVTALTFHDHLRQPALLVLLALIGVAGKYHDVISKQSYKLQQLKTG